MCHYHDFYETDDYEKASIRQQIEAGQELHYNALKQTANKPEGARNCFIQHIRYLGINNFYIETIGNYLNSLFNSIENEQSKNAIEIINEISDFILNKSSDKEILIDDLINVRHSALNSGKYTKNSYKEKLNPLLLCDAAARHYIKLVLGYEKDSESGYLHLSHILANLLLIAYQIDNYGDYNE